MRSPTTAVLGAFLTAWPLLASEPQPVGVSANPGAINQSTGTGQLGELLRLQKDSGVYLGGVWIGDTNYLISGGNEPGSWTWNSLLILSLSLDADKLAGFEGGKLGVEFLQFNGDPTNADAGSLQGYNSLPGPEPLNRSELYQLWWRQELFEGKFILRVGKSVPTNDFNNVLRPVPTQDASLNIPGVSGLLFTPVFLNTTLLGTMPGYYNSACGITATFAPTTNLYLSYGFYDGNLARGVQTGMRGPEFNGYYFHIAEVGAAWELGADHLPGAFGAGAWRQTGTLTGPGVTEDGAMGAYAFASQRLWLQNPGVDNSGISGFIQGGANNSDTLPFQQYFGCGVTGFGLIPGRPADSLGAGLAVSWLNENLFTHENEVMLQAYYQAHLIESSYLQPAITYIPRPGGGADLGEAWALTLRVICLF